MDVTEPTASVRAVGRDGNGGPDQKVLMASKPLHRFVQREPKSLGIVIAMFGCAELLMGFQLATDNHTTSAFIYIPFWQGILFVVCGNLSIYTDLRPSKRMVTVCLAMYVVSILGILVSVGYRMYCLADISHLKYWSRGEKWLLLRANQLLATECVLFGSSLCVGVLLIFLSAVARLALKSTHTQVIVQCIPATAQREATPN